MATRTDPFQGMDRALSSVLNQFATSNRQSMMPLDLYRQDDHFVLVMDLPGVDPNSIDIDVEDRMLTIRAERDSIDAEDIQWFARERQLGAFARQLTLGAGLATDAINAEYEDGVLRLTIPLAEEAKPRRIEVSHVGRQAAITDG